MIVEYTLCGTLRLLALKVPHMIGGCFRWSPSENGLIILVQSGCTEPHQNIAEVKVGLHISIDNCSDMVISSELRQSAHPRIEKQILYSQPFQLQYH